MIEPDLRRLIDALDEPALVVSGGLVQAANPAARQLFGRAIEGSDVRLSIRHPGALERILPGTPGDVEITGIGQFGKPWTLSVRPIDARSLLVRLIDRSAAVAAEKMRVDFVANASHELRTPLTAILGYSETLAEEGELEPDLRVRFGSTIQREAGRMLQIIEDLMSLSRIEADRFVPPADRVHVGSLVSEAVERCRDNAKASACTIEADVEDGLPPILGDEGQLKQLLDNLLSNAIRYGCLKQRCAVRVAVAQDDGFNRLSVADNGPGIPPEHLRRVTERFYRVDPARSQESGGTGLGLAIVKHIVERHRGTLDIRSEVDRGTEVTVRLPVAAPPQSVTPL